MSTHTQSQIVAVRKRLVEQLKAIYVGSDAGDEFDAMADWLLGENALAEDFVEDSGSELEELG